MTAVTYIARRSLIGGHTAGASYSLNLTCLAETPGFSREPNIVQNESLSGARETFRLHAIKSQDIQLAPLAGAALAAVLEFLDSVEAGESFTFDMDGTVASPVSPVTASLAKGGYSKARYQALGAGGATDYFTLTFKVRQVLA